MCGNKEKRDKYYPIAYELYGNSILDKEQMQTILNTKNRSAEIDNKSRKDDFDIYYCSPLKRSSDTLKLVVNNLEKFYIDERITEISIGDWEGKSKKDFSEDLLNEYRNGLYVPPNAEKTEDVDSRIIDFVSDLFNLYDDKTKILVVTHNGIMRSIKRNFVPNYKNIMSNNLENIVLNRENYNYYLGNSRKSKFNR